MIRFFALLLYLTLTVQAGDNVLSRTASRLKDEQKLTIGYFGGSLTDGAGASNPEKTSWRAKTTEWFRGNFPAAKVEEVNASIGGTGSELGVYRIGMDLLEKKPDLIFVEFSVNDDGRSQWAKDEVARNMEGIVRQIWAANPKADIVFVFTTMQAWEPHLAGGKTPPSVEAHSRVAKHYGIPTVDVGAALWETIKSGEHTWEELMPDKVHPTDAGFALYTDAMLTFLEAQDWSKISKAPVVVPGKLDPAAREKARFVHFKEAEAPGWDVEKRRVGRRTECITSNRPGDEVTFRFRGDGVGLFWLSFKDAGVVEWSVDGSPFERASSWSPYGGESGNGFSHMLKEPGSLENGEHELKLRVAAEKDPQSTDNWVRIAAFLVNQP